MNRGWCSWASTAWRSASVSARAGRGRGAGGGRGRRRRAPPPPPFAALERGPPPRERRARDGGAPALLGAQGGQRPLLPLPPPGRQVGRVQALPPQEPAPLPRAPASAG